MLTGSQTTPTLTPSERSRLVRSTRKLQAVLGAAPQDIEAAVFNAPRANCRWTSPETNGRPLCAPHCAHLFLDERHRSFRDLSDDILSSPPIPLSPTSINSSRTPSPPVVELKAPQDRRRQHAAKLSRTLGENVAPELLQSSPVPIPGLRRSTSVFGLESSRSPAPRPQTMARSLSMYSTTSDSDESFVLVSAPPAPAVVPSSQLLSGEPHIFSHDILFAFVFDAIASTCDGTASR
ncbi:hypothetical protein MIND_00186900 [Mycena indigotica]|uniref:Uncharacterized protein n=1 Tax=Mycena indigotica TaxID=2126181 RepID=A0A8H6T470_9AGAR|nr:uncharacterized protein MIND_00186900 [Mycena indigotica]KAF7311765.1 hypothetical protein MIND_00186900 [Mycena indigotica]